MRAIETHFPSCKNVLCIWHIEKNVTANCKKYFPCGDDFSEFLKSWSLVINSNSKNEFTVEWEKMKCRYENSKALLYVQDTWIIWKERFIKAWTNKITHLGNTSTSRGEGAHARLKSYLQVSTGNFRLQFFSNKKCAD